MTANAGPLITARQLAETLGVSTETVLRWTRRRELPAIRLPGGAIRYRANEIEAWLDSRNIGASAHAAPVEPQPEAA